MVQTWDEIFRQLRAEFVRRSAPRLERAGTLLEHLAADRTDSRVLSDFRRELKDFAGHCGSYGSPTVTALAEEGERACAALLDHDQSPGPTDLDRWRALLCAIRNGLGAEAPDAQSRLATHSPK